MALVFREVEERRHEGLAHVLSIVYQRGEPVDFEQSPHDPADRRFVAEREGRTVAGFVLLDMLVTRGEADLRCAGIAGVAVLPEERHLGVGSALMRWSLADLRSRGFHVAALYAFRDSFYRRFGYEVTGRRWQIHCPNQRLPRVAPELPIRQMQPSDAAQLDAPYRVFARAHSGVNLRTEAQWQTRFGRKPPMIYAAGDPVEAYAWVSMEGGFWEDLRVGEFVWASRRGYESILATLTGLGINRTALVWCEPSDSPFLARHADQGVRVSLERAIMFRCLDVPAALRRLRPEGSGEVTLEVEDVELPENRGPWRVVFRPGEVEVAAADSADLRLDIRTFTQALMGEPSVADLLEMGLGDCASEAAARAAAALMPPRATICLDFF